MSVLRGWTDRCR